MKKAQKTAQKVELDLVEVAQDAQPPVCKIIDFGDFLYQQKKKRKKSKGRQKKTKLKHIQIHVNTEEHDLETKSQQAQKFLKQGHKLRLEIFLRGREKAHQDLAHEKLQEFVEMVRKGLNQELKKQQSLKKTPRGMELIVSI